MDLLLGAVVGVRTCMRRGGGVDGIALWDSLDDQERTSCNILYIDMISIVSGGKLQ